MKYVLFVHFDKPAEILLPNTPDEVRQHLSRLYEFRSQGTLLMAGAFRTTGEPLSTMGIFTTRDAAEALAAEDPFVVKGIATGHDIHAWHELVPEPDPRGAAMQCRVKYVATFETAYQSIEEAYERAGAEIARHVARTQDFHAQGSLLMAGAFTDSHPLTTMCVLTSREAAEAYAAGDPFVVNGMARSRIREWTDLLAPPGPDR